jgi:polyhydroxyalkanoate synthesis regulator phasin
MVADALKGYIQLANGLTDVTKDKASAAAKSLAAQTPDVVGTTAQTAVNTAVATALTSAMRAQGLAEDLLVTSRDNRALLMGIIRTEIERVVTALGFAKESEVDAVRHKVDKLEETVDGLGNGTPATPTLRAALTPTKKAAPAKAAAKKPATKRAPATKKATVAKKAPAKKPAPAKVVAKKPATKKAPAKAPAPVPAASTAVSTPATPLVPPTPAPVETPAPEIVDLTRASLPTSASSVDGTQA